MAFLAKKGVEPPIWRKSGLLFFAMTALFFLLVGLFLGQSFQPAKYQNSLVLYVVDFDNDLIGKKMLELTSQVITSGPGWLVLSSVQFPQGPSGVSAKVDSGEAWGAIVVNPGATKKLVDAYNNPSIDYKPQEAITFYYDEGRSPKTIIQYVVVPMRDLAQRVSNEFGAEFIKSANVSAGLTQVIQRNPKLITSPVSYTESNLHPNNAPVADASLTFGQVFLIVFCYAISQAILQLTGPLVLSLELSTLLSLRIRIIIVFCVGISLWYTILHTALGVQFSVGRWFTFWFLNALQMFVHVFTLLDIGILAGRNSPTFPLYFLIVLILNATAGLGVLELGNEFYRWGYAMPMWNAVTACRTLVFGSYNRMALNVGILFAWFVVLLLSYIWIQLSGREFDDEDDDSSSYYANGENGSRNDVSFPPQKWNRPSDYDEANDAVRGARRNDEIAD
ncbi:hypothetical protein HK098_007619 [Nowakowskiella sp. JEL0407]|nr:hypothetical protein HK098_007619 [Nowakowskiella sp. JEL0407]